MVLHSRLALGRDISVLHFFLLVFRLFSTNNSVSIVGGISLFHVIEWFKAVS